MQKSLFILLFLLIVQNSLAQKIIPITDSTALKSYWPKPPHTDRDPEDGPAIRITRNDDALILRKQMSSVTRNTDWAPALTTLSRLQFVAFVNREGRVDSLAYFLVATDTSRSGRAFLMHDRLSHLADPSLVTLLEKEWRSILHQFQAKTMQTGTYGGMMFLSPPPKNLNEFLDAQPENITEINLTDFGLREFPYQLKRFRKLKTLNLKDNFIPSATLHKKDFPHLRSVSFQNNLLRDDSLRFKGGLKPETINLTDNHFTRIPKTHRKIQELFLANSAISQVTKRDIRKIKKIRSLNLYANTLTEISPKIVRLKKLRELDLYRNNLSTLPASLASMKSLETLAVSYNQMEELPARIGALNPLKTLYIHHNILKKLPPLPPNLEVLDVGYNRIEEVAERVLPLKKLITLDYSHNRVKGDLDFLLELPRIKEIYLLENRYAATEEEEKYFSRVFSTLLSKGVMVK